MGWSVSPDARRGLYGPHTTLRPDVVGPAEAHVEVMVDGNAKGRSLAVGTRRAGAVARQILECVGPATRECVLCFDNDNVPTVRKREVHAARAKRSSASATRTVPATADEIDSFTGFGEIEWERLFATAAGKRVALLVLCRALKEEIVRRPAGDCRFTLTLPDATDAAFGDAIWAYPFDRPSKFHEVLCATRYGEAEAQVIACIRHSMAAAAGPPPSTLIHTIDTDVYLQCLSFAHPHLSVVIGAVWQTTDGATHSSAARARSAAAALRAAKRRKAATAGAGSVTTVTRLYKHVSLSEFAAAVFAGDVARMVNAQWWFLLTGGCDYNYTGLAAFGWNHATCLGLRDRMVVDATTLRLGRFAEVLRASRNAKRRNKDVADFCDMLVRTVYCWYYYQWSGAQPELADFSGLLDAGGCDTISDWLSAVPPEATRSLCPATP